MAGIKYKGTDGQWHLFNNVMVNAINVVQTTGTSTADVMSQSAVTEAVNVVSEKADLAVTNVAYSSGKLNQTIGGETTEICNIVTSGFELSFNTNTGIKELNPVGGATAAFNTTTGIKELTF